MDFEFNDDQEQLRDSVRRYLTERAPIAYVRSQYDATAAVDDVWPGLADLGLTAMLVPESHGGAGMGLVDLALPLGEMGRAVYPGPFAASAVAATSLLTDLASDALAAQWLPRLAAGDAVATVAFTDACTTPVTVDASGALHGTKVHVPDGVAADLILVVADDGTTVTAVVPTDAGVTVSPLDTIDGSRKFATVTFAGAFGKRLEGGIAAAVSAADDRLGVAWVLDGIGAAEIALELALDYAKEREQFGKPIGSFQAIQHLCADMLRAIELGRAVGYYAAWACDAADAAERHRAATMARAFAANDFYRVAANAIQVFGGIGFTWEHDIHLFYKRLLTLQLAGGTVSDHLEELASIVL
jgi:Acyl-CoA dehydrogenases